MNDPLVEIVRTRLHAFSVSYFYDGTHSWNVLPAGALTRAEAVARFPTIEEADADRDRRIAEAIVSAVVASIAVEA